MGRAASRLACHDVSARTNGRIGTSTTYGQPFSCWKSGTRTIRSDGNVRGAACWHLRGRRCCHWRDLDRRIACKYARHISISSDHNHRWRRFAAVCELSIQSTHRLTQLLELAFQQRGRRARLKGVNTVNRKRWLPRFSTRMLFAFITLVCLFLGSWELTKTAGVRAVSTQLEASDMNPFDLSAQAPFLVSAYEYRIPAGSLPHPPLRRHHLWLVVASFRLPQHFTSSVERIEDEWYAWTGDGHMRPRRVHGGII